MKRGREEFDDEDIKTFHHACVYRDMATVQEFIERGIDVNVKEEFKRTGLHRAAFYGNFDVAKVLIKNGADANAVDKDNTTPLHCAASNGHVDVAKVLILNGADVNAANKYDQTPLYIGFFNAHEDIVFVLIQSGAVIDKKVLEEDDDGLLVPINDRMNLLRAGKPIGTSLMADEDRRFMWELAFSLVIQNRSVAFKAYYTIRSFITFHGIFMARG